MRDTIEMAREAGLDVDTAWGVPDVTVMRFAALVAEKEREACAEVADFVARELKDMPSPATFIAAAIRARNKE
jgi:hypothetical protein